MLILKRRARTSLRGLSAPLPPPGAFLREDGNWWIHGPDHDEIIGPGSAYSTTSSPAQNTANAQQAAATQAALNAAASAQAALDALNAQIAAANAAALAASKMTIQPVPGGSTSSTTSTAQAQADAAAARAAQDAQAQAAAAIKAANDAIAAANYQLQAAQTEAAKLAAQKALDAANKTAAQILSGSADVGVTPGDGGGLISFGDSPAATASVGGIALTPKVLLIGGAVLFLLASRK